MQAYITWDRGYMHTYKQGDTNTYKYIQIDGGGYGYGDGSRDSESGISIQRHTYRQREADGPTCIQAGYIHTHKHTCRHIHT